MIEKKTSMRSGSSTKSFESIIDITKKVPSFGSLVASIVFDNSFLGWKAIFIGHLN